MHRPVTTERLRSDYKTPHQLVGSGIQVELALERIAVV